MRDFTAPFLTHAGAHIDPGQIRHRVNAHGHAEVLKGVIHLFRRRPL
jgi:hypothetical protein